MKCQKTTVDMNARDRILTVAEEIFLQDGFDGVSVRELTEAAGVNVALVNYYFGGKRNLYLEVLRQKFTSTAAAKCAKLQQIILTQEHPSLRQIITAYVLLYLDSDETMQATQQFLRLISHRLAEDDDAMELLLKELIVPIHLIVKKSMGDICPQLTQEKISLCIGSISGQIFHFLRFPSAFQMLVGLPEKSNLREQVIAHIIEFSLTGINEETTCNSIP